MTGATNSLPPIGFDLPDMVSCIDCGDTGLIGGDPCDVCTDAYEGPEPGPIPAIRRILAASEYNIDGDARRALDEIAAIVNAK